jgi:hypothetical protein
VRNKEANRFGLKNHTHSELAVNPPSTFNANLPTRVKWPPFLFPNMPGASNRRRFSSSTCPKRADLLVVALDTQFAHARQFGHHITLTFAMLNPKKPIAPHTETANNPPQLK